MNIVFVMANNSSVPYFNWFAEAASQEDQVTFSFVCMYPTRPKMLDDMAGYGCECYWVKFDDTKRKISFLSSLFPLYKLFKRLKPDVVHTHLFDDSLPALMAARMAGIKQRVITKGDAGYHYYFTPQWVKFDKLNNWNATNIVAISTENREFIIEKEKANPDKVVLIHHGIPISKFTSQNEAHKKMLIKKYQLAGKKVVGTVARLIEWKGYKYIIEAAEMVLKSHPDTVFLCVGVGTQEEELKQLVREKQLQDQVIFTGWIDREWIPSLYGILDVYVHAASYEPFGFVIAEAMINGVPVVSFSTGAAKDAIRHLENGYLVKEKNAYALAEGIVHMLDDQDYKIKQQTRKTALKMFDFQLMWENHLKLYYHPNGKKFEKS